MDIRRVGYPIMFFLGTATDFILVCSAVQTEDSMIASLRLSLRMRAYLFYTVPGNMPTTSTLQHWASSSHFRGAWNASESEGD
jgi:hypothetical protein